MKIIRMPLAIICTVMVSSTINAQIAMHKSEKEVYAYKGEDLINTVQVDASNVSPLAVKDFKKRFAAAENEKWEQTADGYIASYSRNAVENRVFYNKKGDWSNTILDYNGDKLQKGIRDAVSFDHEGTITKVSEIYTRDKIVYLVRVKNDE